MTPAGIFYFSSGNKRRITSFVELLLFSVGAFLLTSSVISMLISCIRRGQTRRKLASLQITTTNRQNYLENLGIPISLIQCFSVLITSSLTTKLRGSSRYFVVVVSGTQFVSTFHTLVRVVKGYV